MKTENVTPYKEPTDKQVPDFEWIFDLHFAEVMKQGSPSGFKRDYATLWNHVILPAVKEHVEPLKKANSVHVECEIEMAKQLNSLEEEVKKLKEERTGLEEAVKWTANKLNSALDELEKLNNKP